MKNVRHQAINLQQLYHTIETNMVYNNKRMTIIKSNNKNKANHGRMICVSCRCQALAHLSLSQMSFVLVFIYALCKLTVYLCTHMVDTFICWCI